MALSKPRGNKWLGRGWEGLALLAPATFFQPPRAIVLGPIAIETIGLGRLGTNFPIPPVPSLYFAQQLATHFNSFNPSHRDISPPWIILYAFRSFRLLLLHVVAQNQNSPLPK
jgi:hypothetical protein